MQGNSRQKGVHHINLSQRHLRRDKQMLIMFLTPDEPFPISRLRPSCVNVVDNQSCIKASCDSFIKHLNVCRTVGTEI